MPIVVRELIIRARVEEAGSGSGQGVSQNGRPDSAPLRQADIDQIVALCVEKVLQVQERKKDR